MNAPGDTAVTPQRRHYALMLGGYALLGCLICAVSIVIADFVVPDHDWIADTISDLGAGRYEYIVDIGLYAFAASLIAIALLTAHIHLGGWSWSFGSVGFAVLGLIVFLVGARNEYGDKDQDGAEIHVYLVYVLGILVAVLPWAMRPGLLRVGQGYGRVMIGLSLLWIVSSPVFFFIADTVDGLYERYLGLILVALVGIMARALTRHL